MLQIPEVHNLHFTITTELRKPAYVIVVGMSADESKDGLECPTAVSEMSLVVINDILDTAMVGTCAHVNYHDAFVEQLKNLMRTGDVVIGISSSGNSPNVLRAIEYANLNGAFTIGLTGFSGGKIKDLVSHCLVVPSFSIQQIEDVHHTLHHLISMHLRTILKEEKEAF